MKVFHLDAKVVEAPEINREQLRELLKNSLNNPQTFIIANYHRPTIGHNGKGNFSPIGAYDEASDSVLLLDALRHQYGPFWVPLEQLVASMQVKDPLENNRGIAIVHRPYLEVFSEKGIQMIKNSQFSGD